MEQWSSRGGSRGRSSFVPPPSMETSSVVFGDAWVQRLPKKGTLINKILPEPGCTCSITYSQHSCVKKLFFFYVVSLLRLSRIKHSQVIPIENLALKHSIFLFKLFLRYFLEARYWICKKRRRYLTTKKHQATWRDDAGMAPPGWIFFFKFHPLGVILELQCAASRLMFCFST